MGRSCSCIQATSICSLTTVCPTTTSMRPRCSCSECSATSRAFSNTQTSSRGASVTGPTLNTCPTQQTSLVCGGATSTVTADVIGGTHPTYTTTFTVQIGR